MELVFLLEAKAACIGLNFFQFNTFIIIVIVWLPGSIVSAAMSILNYFRVSSPVDCRFEPMI